MDHSSHEGEKQLDYDVIVIGGGAAGLFCASLVGQAGKRVALFEHNKQFGRKILISGGGRCNFTNVHSSPEAFHGENPHFPKSSLSRYTPTDFIDLVESYQVAYYEKKLGQLFCQKSAKELLNALLCECEKGNVDLYTGEGAEEVSVADSEFSVQTTQSRVFSAAKVVLATGGLPLAKLGASDFGLKMAKKFQMKIKETSPGLVPFVHPSEMASLKELAGISVEAEVWAERGPSFRENILFTHKGLSGPAILQVSSYWRPGEEIKVKWLPGEKAWHGAQLRSWQKSHPKKNVLKTLKNDFPKKFVDQLMAPLFNSVEKNFSELSKDEWAALERFLTQWRYRPSSTEGYRKAEVMRGGVSCDELSSKTLESKKVTGLYFIGEVVDVTGWLGGYNFQWAWASAHACAEDLMKR